MGDFARGMKKEIVFTGVGCAVITPFKDGCVDYPALTRIIEREIAEGVDAIVVCGTTGECATLTDAERYRIFAHSHEVCEDKCKLILGVGSNDTLTAVHHTEAASRIGCDGVLAVTPYYNRGTEGGIIKHFLAIAEASAAPVLLYNVPTRTGVNLSINALSVLSEHENIVGIKEASDSHDRLLEVASFGERLWLYAGSDSQIHTVLSLGGLGVISVAANAFPDRVKRISDLFFLERWRESLDWQINLMPLVRLLFRECSPAPIKYLMSRLALCEGELRLPMDEISEELKRQIDVLIK